MDNVMNITNALTIALNGTKLSERDRNGASILLRKAQIYGNLTDRQKQWANDILGRTNHAPAPVVLDTPDTVGAGFNRVMTMLNLAAQKLKKPGIHLLAEGGQPVVLMLDTRMSTVHVKSARGYGSAYFGTILPDGTIHKRHRWTLAVEALIEDLGASVEGSALSYAAKTGLCCFCNRKLEDERSTKAGYGPVCAGNFGLPWNN